MAIVMILGGDRTLAETLITRLVAGLDSRHVRVAVIAAQTTPLEIDIPGKDTHQHRAAGAADVVAVSAARWGRIHEAAGPAPPDLDALAARVADAEIVLALGFDAPRDAEIRITAARGERAAATARLIANGRESPAFRLDKPEPIVDLIQRLARKPVTS